MAKPASRDTGLSLMQNNPPRELLLEKMRSKLATTPPAALVAINYFLIGNRDAITAKIRKPAVPTLPQPSENLSTDEQALYYVYALYDYPKLASTFGLKGFVAVDQNEARRRLDELLPDVGPKTLGEISRYMPVAFKQGPIGRGE